MTQPTTPPERETRVVDVKGRAVVVRQLKDAQLMYMARETKMLRSSEVSTERKMEGVVDLLDILESAVVQELDKIYLRSLMKNGDLEVKDLLGFVSVFVEEVEDEPAKPKVRRGRAPAKRS